MNMKKLAIASAVAAVTGGAFAPAQAYITGVPGEALLVPMVLSSDPTANATQIETYVGISVPSQIGHDTVISQYTAPNVRAAAAPPSPFSPYTQSASLADADGVFEIYWTLFNEDSVKVEDGRCEVSLGDAVLWTTDSAAQAAQVTTQTALDGLGRSVPSPVCGPTTPTRFGYVVFQTIQGADGQNADFAMAGAAGFTSAPGTLVAGDSMGGIPVMPMADGADSASVDYALIGNEVIAGVTWGDGNPESPTVVSPVLSGQRVNNGSDGTQRWRAEMPLQGPQANNGQSLHVFWFDRNDPLRVAALDIYDEHQNACSDTWPLPYELNLVLYNNRVSIAPVVAPPSGWGNMGGSFNDTGYGVTSVIDAVQIAGPVGGYSSGTYCQPRYWTPVPTATPTYAGAMGGYVRYKAPEIGEASPPVPAATSGMVGWNYQENFAVAPGNAPQTQAFSMHMGGDLGIH